ncbi:MAG: spore germination protein [Clostridia bacterium]|nr:spore germination protein [Clostridia bacterium]
MREETKAALMRSPLGACLCENLDMIRTVMNARVNQDLVLREFEIDRVPACAVFLDGMAGRETIDQCVLRPCMERGRDAGAGKRLDDLKKRVLEIDGVETARLVKETVEAVLSGRTALMVDGEEAALLLETRGYERRGVSTTQSESVVQGPQEAFVENMKTNVTLVRRILRTEALVSEYVWVGAGCPTQVALMYLEGAARGDTVALIRKRLRGIGEAVCPGSGYVQQLIEDHPFSVFPQMLQTERPDRAAAGLIEGKVALIVDGSPYALIAPVSLFHLLHASDDTFMRWPYGVFLRAVRTIGALVSLYLPALYVAITIYHAHMIPLNLLTSIAETRARVPFPVIAEIIFMEASFYLLNEAGTRIPNQLGSALGIVGALILGQAAVEASIISPILIIVIALTGLGSYSIPDYGVSVGMQLLRLGFVALAALWGLYGVCLGTWLLCAYLGWLTSFGEPFLAPVAPHRPHNADIILRGPLKSRKDGAGREN